LLCILNINPVMIFDTISGKSQYLNNSVLL
jgi:hypothetical protein